MKFSFPRYLLSKQSVDDRALNRIVLDTLKTNLPAEPIRIIEIGAGIGTMLSRLLRWNIISNVDYVLVDEAAENIEYAREWIPIWAGKSNIKTEKIVGNQLRVFDSTRDVRVFFEQANVFDFIQKKPAPADLLIAHAFLDLLPMPESMSKILSLTKNLAWLTINFDGVTTLEPAIAPTLDEKIERLYHATMDARSTGGESRTGRHLFGHLKNTGVEVLSAGASDWVVHSINGHYPADEAYFLNFILHFFEEALAGNTELNTDEFADWLEMRRSQIERGELVYITHQMDFLVRSNVYR